MNYKDEVQLFAVGVFFGAIVIGVAVFLGAMSYYRSNAIEHGAAQYNQTTGDFEWIEKEFE